MAHSKEITISPAGWDNHAAELLGTVGNAMDYKRQYVEGASLFRVESEGQEIGLYLLRIDMLAAGSEGVLVAAVGHDKETDLTAIIVPVIEKQFIGCKSMRIHTARPGLAKKLSRAGFNAAEIVLRKPL